MLLSDKEIRKKICDLIKKISDYYGGDEEEFLTEYCQIVLQTYCDDLSIPLACFEDLAKRCE